MAGNTTQSSAQLGATRYGATTFAADKSRHQTFHTQIAEDIDAFEALTNIQWNIFTVSKLFNFEINELKLKSLNKKLREYIGIRIDKTNEQYNEEIKSKITIEKGFDLTENDNPALRIEINMIKTNKLDDKEVNIVLIYVGYLMSHGIEEAGEYSAQYPLLISRKKGPAKVTSDVNDFLIKQFDCSIKKYVLDQTDLKWLFVTMLEVDDGIEEDDHMSLTYTLKQLDHKNEMEITVLGGAMKKVWAACRLVSYAERPYFESDNVKRVFEFLNKHVKRVQGIDTNYYTLLRITFPNTEFHTDGQIMARTKETIEIIIKYLIQAITYQTNQEMKMFASFDKK